MASYDGATSLGLNDQTGRPVTAPYARAFGGGLGPALNDQSNRATTAPYARAFAGVGGLPADVIVFPPPVAGGDVVYRMRAYDTTTAQFVYWNSPIIDDTGIFYAGPGPLVDVVLQIILGQPLIALVPGTGIKAMPEQWVKLNLPSNQPATPMFGQVSTNFDTIEAIRAGSIIGLGARLSEAVTAGTVTVTVAINGVAGTLFVILGTGSTGSQVTQASGIDSYVAGDEIGLLYSTNVAFLPNTADLEAWFDVVEVP